MWLYQEVGAFGKVIRVVFLPSWIPCEEAWGALLPLPHVGTQQGDTVYEPESGFSLKPNQAVTLNLDFEPANHKQYISVAYTDTL